MTANVRKKNSFAVREKTLFVIGLVLACGAATFASAQSPEQIAACEGKNNATPAAQNDGCTAVIQSGKFSGKSLGAAYQYRCWARLILSYRQNRSPDDALADCNEAILLNPDNFAALYNRAAVFEKKGDSARAIADYSRLIAHDPSDINSLNNRGLAYITAGKYDLAIEDFGAAIKANSNVNVDSERRLTVTTSMSNRCLAKALAGRFQEALADCNEANRLAPGDANPIGERGFVFLKMGQFEKAISEYDAALRIDAKKSFFLYGRGLAKLKKADVAGGNADIAAAKAIYSGVVDAFRRYGFE